MILRALANSSVISGSLVLCPSLSGCGEPTDSRPPDVPGTIETALQLTLGAEASINDEETVVELCLTPDGLCVPADFRVDECYRYDDIRAFVDGVEIPLAWSGGWSPDQRFEPLPSGGNGYGCSYPMFETTNLGPKVRAASQEITIRIGDDELLTRVSDWLIERTIVVPNTFPKGTEVFVEVQQPTVSAEQRQPNAQDTYFLYDDALLDQEWYRARNDVGPDVVGTSPGISSVAEDAWTDKGFFLQVPTTMPVGTGTFGFSEAWLVLEATCAHAECYITINRGAEVAGISIVEP